MNEILKQKALRQELRELRHDVSIATSTSDSELFHDVVDFEVATLEADIKKVEISLYKWITDVHRYNRHHVDDKNHITSML